MTGHDCLGLHVNIFISKESPRSKEITTRLPKITKKAGRSARITKRLTNMSPNNDKREHGMP